jgi:hypothetical protein
MRFDEYGRQVFDDQAAGYSYPLIPWLMIMIVVKWPYKGGG